MSIFDNSFLMAVLSLIVVIVLDVITYSVRRRRHSVYAIAVRLRDTII